MVAKRVLLCVFSLPVLVHAAAERFSIDVLLPKPVAATDTYIRESLSWVVHPFLLTSDVGKCCKTVSEKGVASLHEDPGIRAQAVDIHRSIISDKDVQKLAHRVEQAKNEPVSVRKELLEQFDDECNTGLQWLTKTIPNFYFHPRISKTVEKNTEVKLEEKHIQTLYAVLLCTAYNAQYASKLDEQAFDAFSESWLSSDDEPEAPKADAAVGKWFDFGRIYAEHFCSLQ